MIKLLRSLILMSGLASSFAEAQAQSAQRLSATQEKCVRSQLEQLQASIGSGMPTQSQMDEINKQVEAIQASCGISNNDAGASASQSTTAN